MYSTRTGLVLGFHGCDKSTVDKVLNGQSQIRESKNSYDWLGNGIYFWEHSPSRALAFARSLKKHPLRSNSVIKTPAVLGAVISLGYCLDLLDYRNLKLVKASHDLLLSTGNAIPKNKGKDQDLLRRELDCAVIELIHTINVPKPFDSVRSVFWEGKLLYENAGFREKNHIQICIRNPNCIKGFFLPRNLNNAYSKV